MNKDTNTPAATPAVDSVASGNLTAFEAAAVELDGWGERELGPALAAHQSTTMPAGGEIAAERAPAQHNNQRISKLEEALMLIAQQSIGPDWTAEQAFQFMRDTARAAKPIRTPAERAHAAPQAAGELPSDDTLEQLMHKHSLIGVAGDYPRHESRLIAFAHDAIAADRAANGFDIAGLGYADQEDNGVVMLRFKNEAASQAFMENYNPTVECTDMPDRAASRAGAAVPALHVRQCDLDIIDRERGIIASKTRDGAWNVPLFAAPVQMDGKPEGEPAKAGTIPEVEQARAALQYFVTFVDQQRMGGKPPYDVCKEALAALDASAVEQVGAQVASTEQDQAHVLPPTRGTDSQLDAELSALHVAVLGLMGKYTRSSFAKQIDLAHYNEGFEDARNEAAALVTELACRCRAQGGNTQPAHEEIVTEGNSLVCTACGTSSVRAATPADLTDEQIEEIYVAHTFSEMSGPELRFARALLATNSTAEEACDLLADLSKWGGQGGMVKANEFVARAAAIVAGQQTTAQGESNA